ncbi:hypothetical protein ACFWFF_11500 [Streptomyces sp. NPDC060223]|uniref:hypothetical protein n=1 Tax=unclassified Streptomyces TaxID=2593676 RepID=UPI00363F43BD
MSLSIRTSSATSLGSPTSVSLGGYASNAAPSGSTNGFWDAVSTGQADAHTVEYRCLFVYNNGIYQVTGVKVAISNQLSGGSTIAVAMNSAAAAPVASYTSAVIASEASAPTTLGWVTSVTLGTLEAGQVRHFWLRRTALGDKAVSGDYVTLAITGTEVIPE